MDTLATFSLFSGIGMLDTAVECAADALGFGIRPVGYAERDGAAAAILLARMANKTLGRAPLWVDCISRLDARPLRGRVDILTASPPCQPYSSAGNRRGNADERSIVPIEHTARIIGECLPAMVFFENVPEWLTDGHFREFGEELCRMGYDFAPPEFVAAGDVGAPHERERVFVMGYRANGKLADGECPDTRSGNADTKSGDSRQRNGSRFADASGELADSEIARREGAEPAGRIRADGRDRECGDSLFPPGRPAFDDELAAFVGRDSTTLESVRGRIAGSALALRQWAALAAGGMDAACMPAIESGFPVVVDGDSRPAISNADLLRCGGSAVVPLAAAYAFAALWLATFPETATIIA